jgi:hypothetical protein
LEGPPNTFHLHPAETPGSSLHDHLKQWGKQGWVNLGPVLIKCEKNVVWGQTRHGLRAWLVESSGYDYTKASKGLFVPTSQMAFPAENLKSQKQKQIANFSSGFWNVENQAIEELN